MLFFKEYILSLTLVINLSSAWANLNARILIIGGGISGLAAANELSNYGFRNITILEADSRLGGRVSTIPFRNKNKLINIFCERKLAIKNCVF
jgi:heterodisulfide reductase subunit A-like polyferredoxin